jgi:2-polyprenyl-3-methyl-5-hydroxy-6-metoxy-1,4-benzoquinol methylase
MSGLKERSCESRAPGEEPFAAAPTDRQEYLRQKADYLRRIAELSFDDREKWTSEEILAVRDFLWPWEHNIRLPHGIYTTNWAGAYPDHTEIMSVINRELRGDFTGTEFLDLGCLEGYFSFESARHGANVLGIDGKIINLKKCEFVKSVLGVGNVRFALDDAMAVTQAKYGTFDVVLALGLLYHLRDPFTFVANMAEICRRFLVLDTHITLVDQPPVIKGKWRPELSDLHDLEFGGKTYAGRLYREFTPGTEQVEKDLSSTASLSDDYSVWLTEESLVAILRDAGFEQIDKVVYPTRETLRWSDVQRDCRVLLVAFKERPPFESRVV